MWKLVLILTISIAVCNAKTEVENKARGKYPFKHPHHHHGLYYLTHYWIFLAIKAKIIFLIGTFISFWVFAGKVFAFLYYFRNKESCKCPEIHHEKIVLPEEPHFDKYSTIFNSLPPGFSKPPIYSSNPPFLSSYERYSRSAKSSMVSNISNILKKIVKRLDITELTFNAMGVKKATCKERFFCEANQEVKNNTLLGMAMYMFSDVGLLKYNRNKTINSIDDCMLIDPHCNII